MCDIWKTHILHYLPAVDYVILIVTNLKYTVGFIYVSPNIRCQGTSRVNISMTINCIVNSPIIPMFRSPESDVRLQFYIGNFLKTTRQVVTIFGLNHL